MEVGKLTVFARRGTGKGESRRLRAKGMVPGICYGARLDQPVPVVVDPKELKASLDPARGRNTVIAVTVKDDGAAAATLSAMLWDYQIDALRRNVTHVDLISIDPDKTIEVDVPLTLVGHAVGTVDGGQIHVERHTLPVRCRPADIPVRFEVDVTPLNIGEALHVSDLTMPSGVEVAIPVGFTLVTCVAPKVEKETAETAAVAVEGSAPGEGAAALAEGDKKEEAGGKADGGDAKKDKK